MTHSFSSRARCLVAANRDALAQGVGAAASALVDVWKAFAGPDTQSPAATEETHAESAESAEPESHAENAETAESISHAESAETAESISHAESAETAEPEPSKGE